MTVVAVFFAMVAAVCGAGWSDTARRLREKEVELNEVRRKALWAEEDADTLFRDRGRWCEEALDARKRLAAVQAALGPEPSTEKP